MQRYLTIGVHDGSENGAHTTGFIIKNGRLKVIDLPNESDPNTGMEFDCTEIDRAIDNFDPAKEHEGIFLTETSPAGDEELAYWEPETDPDAGGRLLPHRFKILAEIQGIAEAREQEIAKNLWYHHAIGKEKDLLELDFDKHYDSEIVGPFESEFEAVKSLLDNTEYWFNEKTNRDEVAVSWVEVEYSGPRIIETEEFIQGEWNVDDAWGEFMTQKRRR